MSKPIYILGISAYYHDSAAALIADGHIVAASQEERFTRKKGDSNFPHNAVAFCLDSAGITEEEIDHIVFYENHLTKFERLLTSYHLTAPSGLRSFLTAFPGWLTQKLWMENDVTREMGVSKRVWLCDHHLSHAASAFFPSPFESSAVLTIDGVGEWSTTTYGVGDGNGVKLTKQMRFPNSIGLLYSAFTYYTGFRINSGEYKLMGLAPYGEPKYMDRIFDHILKLNEDGTIILNQDYFNYVEGLTMTNDNFHDLFDGPPRKPETEITQKEMDVAASVQAALDVIIDKLGRHVREATGQKNLCLAGGVALNVVSMGKLSRSGIFDNIWIQPAAGDAGGALGAAMWFWHDKLGKPRTPNPDDGMQGSLLGLGIADHSTQDDELLDRMGAEWAVHEEEELQKIIADEIAKGRVVGLARGRAEFGPRALGSRSILGDARSPEMQKHMNLAIKYRESFRPFAPMVLEEDAAEYFDLDQPSPYMLLVSPVSESHRIDDTDVDLWGIEKLKFPRSDVPAVTHVDYSARLQTIDDVHAPFMVGVIRGVKEQTGCSVIINTSFNVRGEPIVNTAEDAYRCFMATEMDTLVVGNRVCFKEDQVNRPLSDAERDQWLKRFDLD